ncbi:MAG TPA: caspase family protein [Anaerolineales bacterium]|nr:caspase family protein [Anaerolineales bacterium]
MSGKFALIIGNTEYTDPGLAQLTAPGKDAEDFARVLKDKSICKFDEVNVLFNQTESAIREAIDSLYYLKRPDDLLVLYFSGHGVRDEYGSLYLAVKNTNRSRLRSTAIKSDYVRESMDQSRSKRQVLILDCCNSGAFQQGTKAATGASIGTSSAFEGNGYGRVVLTASDSTQFAWEGDKAIGETENSLFTHFLIRGLEGEADRNRDGNITVDELYDFAYEQVLNITTKQTPGKWSYKEQGEIILRQYVPVGDKKTRTEELRVLHHERLKMIQSRQEKLLQEKEKLESRISESESLRLSSKKSTSSKSWVIPTGIFLILCGFAISALWVSNRIFSLFASPPQTSTDSVSVTPIPSEGNFQTPTAVVSPIIPNFPSYPQLLESLINSEVSYFDGFDNPLVTGSTFSGGAINNGVLEIIGTENWDGVSRKKNFKDGEGIIVDFKYTNDALFEAFFEQGDFGNESYRRFGIFIGDNSILTNEYDGDQLIQSTPLSGNISLNADTGYSLLMAILTDAQFVVAVWDPANPSDILFLREEKDSTWIESDWIFYVQANQGIITLDNYKEITFSNLK